MNTARKKTGYALWWTATIVAAALVTLATQAIPRTFVLDVGTGGDGAFVAGVYQPEVVHAATTRWTGDGARIRLPRVGPFPATVRVRWAGHPARNPDQIRVTAGGQEAIAAGGPGWRTAELVVLEGKHGGEMTVGIHSALTPTGEDGRRLGVLVDRVEVETGGLRALRASGFLHFGWTTLLFLGVMAGGWSAVRLVGDVGPGWSLAGALAGTALAFVALVHQRFELLHLVPAAALLACLAATLLIGAQHPWITRRFDALSDHMAGWKPRTLVFAVAAGGVLALLFNEAFVKGWVLSQADILYNFYPWRAYAPEGFTGSRNPILGDIPQQFYPGLVFSADAVRHGTLPLWNAAMAGGHPHVAAFLTAVFSPFTALAYLVPLPQATVVVAIAVLLVGGLGMFIFVRSLGLGWAAATLAGMAYLLNPFSTAWLEFTLASVAALVPWLLWATERAVRRTSPGRTALLAGLVGLVLLCGQPEMAFKAFLLTGSYGIFCWLSSSRGRRALAMLVVGYAMGALLAAFQILPFVEYLSQSTVLAARKDLAVNKLFAPSATLVTALVPNFLGHHADGSYVITKNRYDYPANHLDHVVYPGMAVWLLAAVGLVARWRDGRARFMAGAAVVSLLLMYGAPGLVELVSSLPLFQVTYLARFGMVTILASIVLAAIGVDVLTRPTFPEARSEPQRVGAPGQPGIRSWPLWLPAAVVTAAVIGAVALALVSMQPVLTQAGRMGSTLRYSVLAMTMAGVILTLIVARARQRLSLALFLPAVIVLLLADLLMFARAFHPLMPASEVFPPLPEIEAIKRDPDLIRVTGYGDNLLPNAATAYGLHDFRGYDGMGLARYSALLDSGFKAIPVGQGSAVHHLVRPEANPLLDLLNVKYIFVSPDVVLPEGPYTRLDLGRAPVYRNNRAFPRMFLVDAYRVETDQDALRILRDGIVDLRRTVLLERHMAPEDLPEAASSAQRVGTAVARRYDDGTVEIETVADGRRLLVLTDVHYPGWHGSVDGRPATIHRANFAFRAVVVPAGEHLVRFDYRPLSFRLGLAVSATAALGLIASVLGVEPWRRRFRASFSREGMSHVMRRAP